MNGRQKGRKTEKKERKKIVKSRKTYYKTDEKRKRANDVTDIIMHFQNLVSYLQPRFLSLALNVYKNIFINSNEEIKIYTETKTITILYLS